MSAGKDYPWFKHDVDMWSDEKVERVTALHGLLSYGLFCYLLERIYREPLMRYRLDTESAWGALSRNVGVPVDDLRTIISAMVDEGLFDRAQYDESRILYSHGAVRRRDERDKKRIHDREYQRKKRQSSDDDPKSYDIDATSRDVAYRDKKEERRREKEELSPPAEPDGVSELDEMCQRIYDAYPRKGAPRVVLAKIRQLIRPPRSSRRDPVPGPELLALVVAFADHCRREGREKKHIPMPTTYFNQERYRDDLREIFPGLYQSQPTTQGPFRTFAR